MRVRKIFFMIFMASVSLHTKAQEKFARGYVINLKGDSLYGFVATAKHNPTAAVFFRETLRSAPTEYHPDQIKVYGFDKGKRFESLTLPVGQNVSETGFARTVLLSRMSLYHYKDSYYAVEGVTTKIVKSDEQSGKAYIQILNALLKECSITADDATYQEKDIAPLIISYNQCKKAALSNYQRQIATPVHFLFYGGLSLASVEINGFNRGKLSNATSATVGTGLEIRIGKSFYLNAELFFLHSTFTLNTEQPGGGQTIVTRSYELDTKFLKLPVGLQYNFAKKDNSPYVKIGLVQYFSLKSSSWNASVEVRNPSTGQVTTQHESNELNEKKQAGFWLGAGYTRRILPGVNLFAEARFERCLGLGTIADQEAIMSSFNLLAGLRF